MWFGTKVDVALSISLNVQSPHVASTETSKIAYVLNVDVIFSTFVVRGVKAAR